MTGVAPVMSEQFYVRFDDELAATAGEARADGRRSSAGSRALRRPPVRVPMCSCIAETADLSAGADISVPGQARPSTSRRAPYRAKPRRAGTTTPEGAL